MITHHDRAEELTRLADAAAEAVRAINHATITGPPMPAPEVYDVLGSLTRVGYGLEQATGQIGVRLSESAEMFELYQDDGNDPGEQLAAATSALAVAVDHAHYLGVLLDAAQSAIAGQGYRP